jgi:hypothetical protein
LNPALLATPPLPTYPSRLPLLPLDRIWFSAPLGLLTAATLSDAEGVSDHLPLVASLRLDAEADHRGMGLAKFPCGDVAANDPNGLGELMPNQPNQDNDNKNPNQQQDEQRRNQQGGTNKPPQRDDEDQRPQR